MPGSQDPRQLKKPSPYRGFFHAKPRGPPRKGSPRRKGWRIGLVVVHLLTEQTKNKGEEKKSATDEKNLRTEIHDVLLAFLKWMFVVHARPAQYIRAGEATTTCGGNGFRKHEREEQGKKAACPGSHGDREYGPCRGKKRAA